MAKTSFGNMVNVGDHQSFTSNIEDSRKTIISAIFKWKNLNFHEQINNFDSIHCKE